MKIRAVLTLVIVVLSFINLSADKSLKQYKKEINKKNRDLNNLQKEIEKKKETQEKYKKEEENIRNEVNKIEEKLNKLKSKARRIRQDLKWAKYNLSKAEKNLENASLEKVQWHEKLNDEVNISLRPYSFNSLYSDKVMMKLHFQSLSRKKYYLDDASEREARSKTALDRWASAKDSLDKLEIQQEKNIESQNSVKQEKAKLLENAAARRIMAEKEIKELKETENAMNKLIAILEKEKRKTELDMLSKKEFKKKKKNLPWPVDGKVVSEFGKHKHPELDTYIINNGIKIRASSGSGVKAVSRGEVIFAEEFRIYGLMVIVDHGGGFYTIYGNLGKIIAEEGAKLKAFDQIGVLSKDSTLYFEVRSGGQADDPLLWLK